MISYAPQLLAGALLAGLIALFSRGTKLLTRSGAWAAALVGFVVFGIGGMPHGGLEMVQAGRREGIHLEGGLGALPFAAPLLAFFFSSSILSRVGKARKAAQQVHYDKTAVRDAAQVLANGGVAAALVLLYAMNLASLPPRHAALLFLAALSAVNADTWATEIGGLWKGRPVLVTTMRRVDAGVSGAVSLAGLAGAIAGAFFIVLVGWLAWPQASPLLLWKPDAAEILAIGWAGFVAAFGDSVLGASVQAQYRCAACGTLTESRFHCGGPAILKRGKPFIANDVVNLATSLMGVIFAQILLNTFASPK